MDALFGRAAGLRRVELVEPKHVIGKSSAESIQSGMIYGFSAPGRRARRPVRGRARAVRGHRDRRTGRADHPALAYGAALRAVAHAASVCGSSSNGIAEWHGTTSSRPGSPRSRRSAPAATIRIPSASTARTRSREVREHWDDKIDAGASTDDVVRVAGRVLLKRAQGKLVFANVRDGTGELQLFVSQGVLGDDAFDALRRRGRPRRLGRRRGHGHEDQARRALGERRVVPAARRRRCGRCPRSGTASPTPTRATASATSTSSRTTTRAACSTSASRRSARCAASSPSAGFVEVETPVLHADRRRRDRAARSRRTTTRSTSSCPCASRPSCT